MIEGLRDAQYRFNRIKSLQLQEMDVPTVRWVINEKDIERRRREVELNKLYKDAYLAWEGVHENQDYQRFGTSPVKGAYWQIQYPEGPYVWKDHIVKKPQCVKTTQVTPPEIREYFDPLLLSKPVPTMVFRRFGNLLPPEEELDILVKALLGFPKPMGYKQGNHNAILNDSWTINLRSTIEESENIMMDAFLRGFDGQAEQLKKAWEGKQVVGVDVSDELKDLLKVYTDAEEHLKQKESSALQLLESYAKKYLDAKEERVKVSKKLEALKSKMAAGQSCQSCGEDHDEDEEDEEE